MGDVHCTIVIVVKISNNFDLFKLNKKLLNDRNQNRNFFPRHVLIFRLWTTVVTIGTIFNCIKRRMIF